MSSQPNLTPHPISFGPEFVSEAQRKALGGSLWTYLWCLCRVTPESPAVSPESADTPRWATVANGRPVTHAEMAKGLGCSLSTLKADLKRLAVAGYMEVIPDPRGVQLKVHLPEGWGRVNSQPSQPSPPSEIRPAPLAARLESKLAPRPDGYRADRFRVLLEAYSEICRDRGVRPLLDWANRQAALGFLRHHPEITAEKLTAALRRFSAVSGDLTLTAFVKASEEELETL